MRWGVKKALAIALVCLWSVALAACGAAGNSNSGAGPAASSSSPSASAPSPSAASPQASAESASGPITMEDAVGTVTLQKVPERIVAMDFSFTDALATLDVQPVGIADDDDPGLFMDAVKSKLTNYQSVGSRYEPNIERISALQPDLIIVDINKHKNALEQLKGIAPLLILDDYEADYDQMIKNYRIIAKAVGKEAEGEKRLAEHQAIIDEAKAKLGGAKLTVLPAVVNPTGFFAHSEHSFSGSFLAMMGFDDPVKNETSYPQLSLEQLVETNPQALFLLPTDQKTIVDQWESNPLWKQIDAAANGKVFTVERRDWSLSRGLLGSEKMAADLVSALGA
ncbi:ABC transporter substrate-binding protein [Cohnella zeiphila]|uniref:ABC transporter substrate-binding protein n=1 Tax=Cohnella zeiphila TaxID=2761120 RepID=A0A7X0SLK7_9BACL|nr:Fe(3+) dicitrate ABC transporter substrate-binding protein [Cohnella zeiphila]MBB6731069.1 ABC transporter substrate-binding protein [Cohnella zeiphila]